MSFSRLEMFGSHPLLARICALIVLPILIAGGALYKNLRSGLPQPGYSILLGIDGPISLYNDSYGVPSIKAKTDGDVFFAMGYLHARDRGWQLELQRRIAQGRLSEVLGESGLPQDVWFRTLGIYRAASRARKNLGPAALTSLNAYAAGVNYWYQSGGALAPEMQALGIKPEAWQPSDSLAIMKLVALAMAGGMQAELERSAAQQSLSPAQFGTLYPQADVGSADRRLALLDSANHALLERSAELSMPSQAFSHFAGSNAWVVSGKLSKTGHPALANDPHMALGMPSSWYVVQQNGAELSGQGMSLVGLPLIVFGKNRNIAWGGTNMMADTQDLYIEQVKDTTEANYLDRDSWKSFLVREEVITVAPKPPGWLHEPVNPLRIKVRETVRGPIISDALPHMAHPLSLRWTALDNDDTSYEAFFRLNYARNWEQFRTALAYQVAPVLNMLYADVAGNIGYVAAGRIPIRAAGTGDIPRAGWSGGFRWKNYVPAERMPALYNPESGYIVSANNQIDGVAYPDFVTLDWAPPYRAERIKQMILQTQHDGQAIDLARHQAIQQDVLALDAREILPYLMTTNPASEQQRQAMQLLRRWDGRMTRDSAAATIYAAWTSNLRELVLTPKMNKYRDQRQDTIIRRALIEHLPPQALQRILADKTNNWCTQSGCADELRLSLANAVRDLSKLGGKSPKDWNWGSVHTVHLRHFPFGGIPLLGTIFERRVASEGGEQTVNVARASLNGEHGYEQLFGAVFRQIMEPGEGMHLFINSSGQSGNPVSNNYADLIPLYANGQYLQLGSDLQRSRP